LVGDSFPIFWSGQPSVSWPCPPWASPCFCDILASPKKNWVGLPQPSSPKKPSAFQTPKGISNVISSLLVLGHLVLDPALLSKSKGPGLGVYESILGSTVKPYK
jgi:hypothetical protein